MTRGIDYAQFPHPSPAAIKAAGFSFVMRYASPAAANDANGKNLLKNELTALLAAGVQVGLVFEYAAQQMLGGKVAGVTDAQHSDAVCKGLGVPGLPVYFAADWDVAQAQQAQVNAYLDGAASVIGYARTGVYGGFWPVKRALDGKHATWAWQTLAWSGGQWDPRANIRQYLGVSVGGASCDLDVAMTADFGQWPRPAVVTPPVTPPPVTPPSYPVPASLAVTVRPLVTLAWPEGSPASPHWRVQVAADKSGAPGAVVSSIVVTSPHASVTVSAPGRYWARVQAAGNSPFTAWKAIIA